MAVPFFLSPNKKHSWSVNLLLNIFQQLKIINFVALEKMVVFVYKMHLITYLIRIAIVYAA